MARASRMPANSFAAGREHRDRGLMPWASLCRTRVVIGCPFCLPFGPDIGWYTNLSTMAYRTAAMTMLHGNTYFCIKVHQEVNKDSQNRRWPTHGQAQSSHVRL